METMTDFIFLGSKITADDDCSHEIKRRSLKEKSEKVVLKLNIQKTKIMASSPIISWQKERETMETVRDFILGGSRITEDGDCSHELKRPLEEKL